MAAASKLDKTVLNFNIGVLGHVDSGKTSLAKTLSTVASTASFDKNPQSKERGITLDLGFSSFTVDVPDHVIGNSNSGSRYDLLQYTLVDCPGHASLIKTIIGGAQIIDLMMLVIDVTKGVQTQTAECLVIGQLTCPKMVVILNKIDLLAENKRQSSIEKMMKKLQKTLASVGFSGSEIIPVAANPSEDVEPIGIQSLIEALKKHTYVPDRNPKGPFTFSVDHCFSIRGQGTVMTGTVLSGSIAVNDTIEIPSMKVTKKVKSLQMFRQPIVSISQGDRAGICVTQFDPKQLERGLVCAPGILPSISAGIATIKKVPYYKGAISTKGKFHITMGHDTVMARVSIFGCLDSNAEPNNFTFEKEYKYQQEYVEKEDGEPSEDGHIQYVLLEFEKPVTCASRGLVIGSKLDADIHTSMCRIAFHGVLVEAITDSKYLQMVLPKLKVFKYKSKEGIVERMVDAYTVIGRSLFKKESNINAFVQLKVNLSTGEQGVIESSFGQSGKFKVAIRDGLKPSTKEKLAKKRGQKATKEEQGEIADAEPVKIVLSFKRYVYDPKKQMLQ